MRHLLLDTKKQLQGPHTEPKRRNEKHPSARKSTAALTLSAVPEISKIMLPHTTSTSTSWWLLFVKISVQSSRSATMQSLRVSQVAHLVSHSKSSKTTSAVVKSQISKINQECNENRLPRMVGESVDRLGERVGLAVTKLAQNINTIEIDLTPQQHNFSKD